MDLDRDSSHTDDEYFMTAAEIFDYCGGDHTGTLRVDALMEKLSPFVKTNKAECCYLHSLLDPDHSNPEIDVSTLAHALHQYSDGQKNNLDESFNLKTGPLPQDSDSGISSDGFHLVEELQSEVREKAHLALKLRAQLDMTDRHHEEALGAITAERDSLRAQLALLREENITLTHVRRDYEEACERLCQSEQALGDARRDLESFRKKAKLLQDEVAQLENEKLTLQELLTKSKAECHRMNEMYAARQSSLLEQNESLRTQHADLTVRLQDQEQYLQQLIKEKVILEMELKDLLNKSNHTQLQMDHSIEVSFTEDQMLTALDTLNMDTRFSSDQLSVSTQAEVPCVQCEERKALTQHKSVRRYLWEPLKSLFQAFAVVCFICAISVLYGVTRRWNTRCQRDRPTVPWRWFDAQDMMDLLLRIDYVAEVPM